MSSVTVMLTTAGRTRSTSVATSGTPESTGGEGKGASFERGAAAALDGAVEGGEDDTGLPAGAS